MFFRHTGLEARLKVRRLREATDWDGDFMLTVLFDFLEELILIHGGLFGSAVYGSHCD